MANENFFARWSRRKLASEDKAAAPAAAAPPTDAPLAKAVDTAAPSVPAPAAATELPPLTLDDVAKLTPDSDYSAFVARGVDETVKRSALKKLFTDPHFNIMDGLDIYIDDYSKFEPIPPEMLASLNHAKALLNPLSQFEKPLMGLLEVDPLPPEEAPTEENAEDDIVENDTPEAGDPNETTQEKPENDSPIQSM